MKHSDYTITIDTQRDLVRISLYGFFRTEDISEFVDALTYAQKRLHSAANQHLTLVDIREMQIQSQESVGAFQRVIANPAIKSRRIAFIVARSLARLQVQRAAQDRAAAYFTEPADAEGWLLGEAAAAA